MNWHYIDREKIFEIVDSTPTGLSDSDASIRLAEFCISKWKRRKRHHETSTVKNKWKPVFWRNRVSYNFGWYSYGFITLVTQYWAIATGHAHWQTMVFTVLSLLQLGHVFSIRSDREFLYSQGIFSNSQLFGAVALTFILQLGVIYLPIVNSIFRTEPLGSRWVEN